MSQARIMIVDDEYLTRAGLRLVLHRAGFVVSTYVDGQEALLALEECHRAGSLPELLVLDLVMPQMGGSELLRQLEARGIVVPAIVISAYVAQEFAQWLRLHAKAVLLPKPFTPEELLACVRSVLEAPSAEEQRAFS